MSFNMFYADFALLPTINGNLRLPVNKAYAMTHSVKDVLPNPLETWRQVFLDSVIALNICRRSSSPFCGGFSSIRIGTQ